MDIHKKRGYAMPNVIEITDFSAPELDVYARLTEAQLLNRFEPAKGMFIAESPKVIHRALDSGCVPVSLLMERKDIEGSAAEIIARCPEIPGHRTQGLGWRAGDSERFSPRARHLALLI